MSELLEALIPKNGLCTAIIGNGLRCDYGVTITAAACEFFYRGGGSFIDSDTNLHLICAQSTTLRSNDPSKCVGKVHCVLSLRITGNPNERIVESVQDVPPSECAIESDFTLIPKATVPESVLKAGDLLQLIACRAGAISPATTKR